MGSFVGRSKPKLRKGGRELLTWSNFSGMGAASLEVPWFGGVKGVFECSLDWRGFGREAHVMARLDKLEELLWVDSMGVLLMDAPITGLVGKENMRSFGLLGRDRFRR